MKELMSLLIYSHFSALLLLGCLFAWFKEITTLIYYQMSFSTSILGMIILVAYFIIGKKLKKGEELNFLYGWKSFSKYTHGRAESMDSTFTRLFRFLIITTILIAPLLRHLHERYLAEYFSGTASLYFISIIPIFLISFVLTALLAPLRSDYANSIEKIQETLDELDEKFIGCKYYLDLKKQLRQYIDSSGYPAHLSEVAWDRYLSGRIFNWKLLLLEETVRFISLGFSLENSGIHLSIEEERRHVDNLLSRAHLCIREISSNDSNK